MGGDGDGDGGGLRKPCFVLQTLCLDLIELVRETHNEKSSKCYYGCYNLRETIVTFDVPTIVLGSYE
ncbi:hypothetical protein M0804_005185 [Polistes exclamans]|nr:hypothetical protein M0804_005185 [Polistes exclamans]